MKKIFCLILGVTIAFSMTSCMPPRRETEAEKRAKILIEEDNAKLDAIIEKSKALETADETNID